MSGLLSIVQEILPIGLLSIEWVVFRFNEGHRSESHRECDVLKMKFKGIRTSSGAAEAISYLQIKKASAFWPGNSHIYVQALREVGSAPN